MASKSKSWSTLSAVPAPAANDAIVARSPMFKRPASLSAKGTNTKRVAEEDLSNIDPDDLFVRFTIPEIRSIQAKLREDADAKQEELRQMVGERYRDLLKASTSIISISESSKRVVNALSEMRETMLEDENEQRPRRSSVQGKDDAHLKALQSLSAHLKLLLDAPEHLWRLLEKKQHLPAAWLFLLARVVHRALVTEDPEESWEREGIDVLSQFPLVQRQWDSIAQFRSQIAHRATQYLRECSISSETACHTLLTLHLLDSLPLPETISTLLSQRSRTLNALFVRNLDFRSTSRSVSPAGRNYEVASSQRLSSPGPVALKKNRRHKKAVKVVRSAVLELLDVIDGTMRTTRDVFRADCDGTKSLIEQSLEAIQSDTPTKSILTTSSLLSTLPSSTHLLTLPKSILSYKPYIDITSSSTHVDAGTLDAKLSPWFDKAIHGFDGRIRAWFDGLKAIREVWDVRRRVLKRLQTTQGLEETESRRIQTCLDDGVKDRVNEVSKVALREVEAVVHGALSNAVDDVRNEVEEARMDVSPSTFLFSSPPLPLVSQPSTLSGATMTTFQSFKDSLRQRVDARTPVLGAFLSIIESKARELDEDLEAMIGDDEITCGLRRQVMAAYYPAVQQCLNKIINILERLFPAENMGDDGVTEKSMVVVVFLGRISYSMASSCFARRLRCQDDSFQDFRDALKTLHACSLTRWRRHAVSRALKQYLPAITALRSISLIEFTWPSQPTPYLTNSLLSLTSSLQDLGLPRSDLDSKRITIELVREFKGSITNIISVDAQVWREDAEVLWDLTFLRRLRHFESKSADDSTGPGDTLSKEVELFQSRLRETQQEETALQFITHIDRTVNLYLLRSQTLLVPLIGTESPSKNTLSNGNALEQAHISKAKPTALLPFGVPATDQDYRPAMEVMKPSARFGLLSVGSTAV